MARAATCNRRLLQDLDRSVYDFGQKVRAELRKCVGQYYNIEQPNQDAKTLQFWGCTLGPLAWDVSGSVLLLVAHNERRAPTILNRSLFEYEVRLRYYEKRRDKAREAIEQIPERFKRILRADPSRRGYADMTAQERADFQSWVDERSKIQRENFKDELLKTAVGEDMAAVAYDGYYGKASAYVHGYETTMRDVLRDLFQGVAAPNIDWRSKVFPPNDTAAVCIHTLLDMLKLVRFRGGVLIGHQAV